MSELNLHPNEPITFALVHGAHHDASAWDKLRPVLENLGYDTVAMNLPIDQLDANLDTYAEYIATALDGRKKVVLVGHSRMGKAIPRVPALTPISRLVYLNAVIKPAANQEAEAAAQPKPILPSYERGRVAIKGSSLVNYDRSKAMVYYSDFDPEDREIEASLEDINKVISRLRPQNRSDDAPPLDKQPDIPSAYILSKEDRVVSPKYSRYAAMVYLGVTAIEMPGGHSPLLLRPTHLATILHNIVQH